MADVKELENLTESEELVMKIIYNHDEPMSLMEILDECNRSYGKEWAPQTVSTFLHRIVVKGYLEFYRKGRVFYYNPVVSYADYLKNKTSSFLKFWFKDNVGDMMESLTHSRRLRPEEIESIRELISE